MLQDDIILDMVRKNRQELPRIGTRKLLFMMKDELSSMGISIGRDNLFCLLSENNMLIKQKRSKTKTTISNHRYYKYPNLIKGRVISEPNAVWVSDITYIRIGKGFIYLFLITDAYSHKIVGWKLAHDLSTKHALDALKKAIKELPKGHTLTHHSDRGTQYCCNEYVKLLNDNNIAISMTENGDPLENAIAERVNGILKTEWINDRQIDNFKDATNFINRIIYLYNCVRPHLSINYLTPVVVHNTGVAVDRAWKSYYRNNTEMPSASQ